MIGCVSTCRIGSPARSFEMYNVSELHQGRLQPPRRASTLVISEHFTAGGLLILSLALFGVGSTLPLVGERGNPRIYTLPPEDQLDAIGLNPGAWRWANVLMGAAAIVLASGLALLAALLGDATLARLGLMTFMIAAVIWVVFSAYRATVPIQVADVIAGGGSLPAYHQSLAQWAGALFTTYATLAFLSLAAYGGAIIQTGLLAGWVGWATIIFSLGLLLLMLVMGDTLPGFHYVPPLLIGILLLIRDSP